MSWLTVNWDTAEKIMLEDLLPDSIESGGRYTLTVSKGAILDCGMGELTSLIVHLVTVHDFDVADLSDLSSVAILHRDSKKGSSNLVVKPAPFKRPGFNRELPSKQSRALVLRQKGGPTYGIKAAAFAFFIIVVLGALFYAGSRRRR